MATTRGKAGNRPQNGPVRNPETEVATRSLEVLTLSEAAAYLRASEKDVLCLANLHELPGREIGNEWRFLKAGLRDWLRAPSRDSGREALLALAGAWKDDPDIEEIVRNAHRRRGRPTTGE
jgi:excisionase family DNA binding protein